MVRAQRSTCLCIHAIGAFLTLGSLAIAAQLDAAPPRDVAAPRSQASERPPETADGRKDKPVASRRSSRTVQKDAALLAKGTARAAAAKRRSLAKPGATNTWLIFGFTEGSDVGQKGEWGIFQDSVVRATRQESGFAAWDGALGIGYSPTDRLAISLAAAPSFERNADQASAPHGTTPTNSRGFGAIAGFKYQVFRRDQFPVGLALQVSPYWQRIANAPYGYDTVGVELRLIADRVLVPGRWFAAVNLAYLPHRDAYVDGGTLNQAIFEVSGALSHRLFGDLFVGAEVRHVSKHQSYLIDQPIGHALYFGPTLFTLVGEHGYFGIAWSAQVAGHPRINTTPHLDAQNFDRHQVRVKAGISF